MVKVTVGELTLSSMSGQLQKIMHKHSTDDSSPNTSPVMVKNEMDIVNYAENNQMNPIEVYYGRSSYRRDSHFNNSREKINCGGRRQGNKNKTRSTNKKKLNPLDLSGNITVCFNCSCKFHWSYDCPYVHSSRNKNGSKKEEDSQKKKIVKIKGVRTFKFGNVNKLNSLYKVILPCVIADIEVTIITDVVDSDIPLLLSKDTMKRAGTCLNFENDSYGVKKENSIELHIIWTLLHSYYQTSTRQT